MKILVLNQEYPPIGGGASPVTASLCRHYAQLGHHVDVVTMGFKNLPATETVDRVNIHRVPCWRRRANLCHPHELATFLPAALGRSLALLRRHHHDIIHCHFIIPCGVAALLAGKITQTPYVITAHGSDVPGFNSDRFQLIHRFTRPPLQVICRHAAALTAPSTFLQNLIHQRIGCYPIHQIPNGIDPTRFSRASQTAKQNIILATGRLLPRKGFQTLIRAVHDLALPYEVHIAGDGPYRTHLEELARNSQTPVIFHGWIEPNRPEFYRLYQQAAIYVLPSAQENASVALLEAMAAGCAVVTSNVSGCPETVADAGELIDFDDHQHLRQILQHWSQHPEQVQHFGRLARARIEQKFRWSAIVDAYLSLFDHCLRRRPAS